MGYNSLNSNILEECRSRKCSDGNFEAYKQIHGEIISKLYQGLRKQKDNNTKYSETQLGEKEPNINAEIAEEEFVL